MSEDDRQNASDALRAGETPNPMGRPTADGAGSAGPHPGGQPKEMASGTGTDGQGPIPDSGKNGQAPQNLGRTSKDGAGSARPSSGVEQKGMDGQGPILDDGSRRTGLTQPVPLTPQTGASVDSRARPSTGDRRTPPGRREAPTQAARRTPATNVVKVVNDGTVDDPAGQTPDQAAGRPKPGMRRPFGIRRQAPHPGSQTDQSTTNVVKVVNDGSSPRQGSSSADGLLADLRLLDSLKQGQAVRAPSIEPTRLRAPTSSEYKIGPQGPSEETILQIRAATKRKLGKRTSDAKLLPGEGSRASRESASPVARRGTTVSQSTIDAYLRRGQSLVDRYRRERHLDISVDEMSSVEFANWLLTLKPSLKSSSWRMYRQCAIYFLEGVPGTERALGILEADVMDRSRPAKTPDPDTPPNAIRRRTSALKEKRFPLHDFERVIAFLRTYNRSRYAPILVDWLRAGVLTGLRPIEWRATDLEIIRDPSSAQGRKAFLYVINAKGTNGRGTGTARTLDLSDFSDEDLSTVRRMVSRARDWLDNGTYNDVQNDCSKTLYGVVRRIWPNRKYAYALYSTRHQAIANWKAIQGPDGQNLLSREQIAAMVGHGVTATAAESYGKRRSSWPPEAVPTPPRPVAEELSLVRTQVRLFEERIAMEQKAGVRKEGDIPVFPLA